MIIVIRKILILNSIKLIIINIKIKTLILYQIMQFNKLMKFKMIKLKKIKNIVIMVHIK